MSTHTPGPWHFGDTAGPIGITVDGSDCHGFRNHVWIAKNIATEADARLISAAPDLLEAIQKLADYTEEKCREQCAEYAIAYFPPDDLLEAYAAINKALGI